jgi:ubiquinone/menaquinone biosynthesis C-methylase UbiE
MNRIIILAALFWLCGAIPSVNAADSARRPGENAFYSSVPTAYMDDPRREEWQQPEKVLDHLNIKPGEVVADIGAGTGYFTMLLAKRVGKGGTVFAVDVEQEMVDLVVNRAKKEGYANVKGILASFDDPGIPKGAIDLVFICDTYLFFENRDAYLLRLRDRLKSTGRLAVVSFNYRAEIPGAPPRHKMVPKEQTVAEMASAGFVLAADYTFLPYQDFLLFTKR